MIWRLCKIFRVRPTDGFFDGITSPEQAWLFTMINQDVKEEYENELAFTEYLASFSNPEAVKHIREERKKPRTLTDDEFKSMLGGMFGRHPTFRPKDT
jgi:hypothetical protein